MVSIFLTVSSVFLILFVLDVVILFPSLVKRRGLILPISSSIHRSRAEMSDMLVVTSVLILLMVSTSSGNCLRYSIDSLDRSSSVPTFSNRYRLSPSVMDEVWERLSVFSLAGVLAVSFTVS